MMTHVFNRFLLGLLCFLTAFPACAQSEMEPQPQEDGPPRLVDAFPNLSFRRPVDFQQPEGSDQVFVVEQAGVIRVFDNDPAATEAHVFLDIRDRVRDSGNEEGLLGLAFHPDYASNGYFFVDYTASDPRRTVIARYSTSGGTAVRESEEVILEVNQPYGNHNAGQIVFGPDGYLYVTLGDGGSGGDPEENGQNPRSLLGSILRIDVDRQEAGKRYAVPEDNPFVDNANGYREEIYAWGLRNPWRISFDPETSRLWAGDVGQNRFEEVDVIEKGKNYGWDVMEGLHCFEPSSGCDESGLVKPVWEYDHSEGSSITGGYVYRGPSAPSLVGKYIYGDFVSGKIWALTYTGGRAANRELMDTSLGISSFGIDRNGELYVLAFDGKVYRLTAGT